MTADFLLGGIFSYDGVHPQRIGYAVVADNLIQFINAEYGNTIPRVNMAEVLFEGDWQTPGVSPAKARETVMSREAFLQLLQARAAEARPGAANPQTESRTCRTTSDRDPRSKAGSAPLNACLPNFKARARPGLFYYSRTRCVNHQWM